MPPPMKYLYAHKKKSVKKYFLTRSGEKSRSRRIPEGDFFTVVVGRSPSPCATLGNRKKPREGMEEPPTSIFIFPCSRYE